jgi:hypothetical protein
METQAHKARKVQPEPKVILVQQGKQEPMELMVLTVVMVVMALKVHKEYKALQAKMQGP